VIQALVAKQDNSDHALGAAIIEDASGPNVLQKLSRRYQAATRDWLRAENDLRRRQAERLSRPADPDPPAAAAPAPDDAPPEPAPPPAEPVAASPEPIPARNEPNPAPGPTNPQPLPPTPASKSVPRGFNPNNPHHPPIELCPSCNSKGEIHDRCYFQAREPRK